MADYSEEQIQKLAAALSVAANIQTQSPVKGKAYKPYYRESFALDLKATLDHVSSTGEPMLIGLNGMKLNSLKLKYYQALEYLTDHLDPAGAYASLIKDKLFVNHYPNKGIVIRPKKERGVLAGMTIKDWRPDFLAFLETAQHMDKFERVGIPITVEDLEWIKEQMRGIEHMFMCDNTMNGLLMIRYDSTKGTV